MRVEAVYYWSEERFRKLLRRIQEFLEKIFILSNQILILTRNLISDQSPREAMKFII